MTPLNKDLKTFLNFLGHGGKYQYFQNVNKVWEILPFEVGNVPPVPIWDEVSFSVNPIIKKADRFSRGKTEDVQAVNCLFADFDIKDGWTFEKIEKLNPSPSVIIFSGGGWHCYWILKDSVIVSKENIEELRQIESAWVIFLGADKGAKDLPHLLRVPGSMNNKKEYNPSRLVEFIQTDYDLLYTLDELKAFMNFKFIEKKPSIPIVIDSETKGKVKEALDKLSQERKDDYMGWLKVGMALETLGDEYLLLWDEWSSDGKNYTDSVCATKWTSFHSDRESRINIASIFEWVKMDSEDVSIPPIFSEEQTTTTPLLMQDTNILIDEDIEEKNGLTNRGNSTRFIKLHGDIVRYCGDAWYIWNGKIWKKDDTNQIYILYEDVIRLILKEASEAHDSKDIDAIRKHSKNSESASYAKDTLFWCISKLPIRKNEFDADNELVNVNNGIINLRTGELLNHDKKYLMTKIIPFDYFPDAQCPKWLGFLDYAIQNKETIYWMQKALGLSLSGRVDKVIPLMYGKPGTGKSTFSETMLKIFGDYGHKTSLDAFSSGDFERAGDKPNSRLKDLRGARFVVANETKDGQKLDVSLMKDISGGDTLNPRGQHAHEAEKWIPTHTFWIYGNHKPSIGVDDAMFERVCIIDFIGLITPEKKRKMDDVISDFLTEASGILNWMVQGYQMWVREGLQKTDAIKRATDEYRDEEDIFKQFIEECMEFGSDFKILKDTLKTKFDIYCSKETNKKSTMGKSKITRRLKSDWNISDSGSGKIWFNGLKLTTEMEKHLMDDFFQ